jgi:hydrogenase expression/formation protein HypC
MMCLGVPGLLVERQAASEELASGIVEFAGIRRRVCLACVPDAQPGDYVLVHAGIAISTIDATEAQRVFAHLRAMDDSEGWTETSP